jgi:hypothetical protein
MIRLLLPLLLLLLTGGCASERGQPLSELRGSDPRGGGIVVQHHYVTGSAEAAAMIERKRRYLELLFEQHRDGFGNNILSPACVRENKIYPLERAGDQLVLRAEVHATESMALNVGVCPNTAGVGKVYYFLAYCPRGRAVLEIKLRHRYLRDAKRLSPCE